MEHERQQLQLQQLQQQQLQTPPPKRSSSASLGPTPEKLSAPCRRNACSGSRPLKNTLSGSSQRAASGSAGSAGPRMLHQAQAPVSATAESTSRASSRDQMPSKRSQVNNGLYGMEGLSAAGAPPPGAASTRCCTSSGGVGGMANRTPSHVSRCEDQSRMAASLALTNAASTGCKAVDVRDTGDLSR